MMFKKTRYSPEVPVRRKRHAGTTTFISSDIAEEEHAKESEGSSNEREDSPELIAQLGLPSAAKRPCLLTAEELCDDMKFSVESADDDSDRRPQRDVRLRKAHFVSLEQKKSNIKSVVNFLHSRVITPASDFLCQPPLPFFTVRHAMVVVYFCIGSISGESDFN
uniref:Uncharacterized protein n=1 Tax=Parascaris equorum TaxID=6256 RepID=A0A914RJ27_PAREQ